ncbi:MAG: FAD-dependent oxidoreductase [Rhodospirillaceae bacterium]|nr:FAD-dependent oxidoreductase [Rhodospirillaceae bacterium]
MTQHARVVVIGGGVVGASALYHLAKLGWKDCVLIERDELSSGSTWHAAGNVPTFSGSWNIMKMQAYSARLYKNLGAEVDYPMNYHITGSIRLAHSKSRMEEFAHACAMAKAQGLDYAMMSPADIKAKYPIMEMDGIVGGLWDAHDGDIDPSQLTQALAKGAKDMGAKVLRFNGVTAIKQLASGEWQVTTKDGTVFVAEKVINAAGYRAGEVAAMVGQYLPIIAMQHQYLITEMIPELAARAEKLPLVRDPDVSYYLRQERDGLILGPYEWNCKADWHDGIPAEFAFQLWPDDLDRLESYIEQAVARVPVLGQVGVQKVINGPIPYSPDGNPYIGPQHGLTNFYNCNTFSFGICQGGGAGKTIAEYIVHGEPEWDLWGLDHRRYTVFADQKYVTDKAIELYQNEYAIGFPNEERPAGRPRLKTPLYDKLVAKGAVMGARGGWERAAYFPRNPAEAEAKLSFHRAEMSWFEPVRAECDAVANRVGIMDLGGFSKFIVEGKGAEAWLDHLVCGALPKSNRVTLAYTLTPRGSINSEFTMTRLAPDRFYLMSAGSGLWHDIDWLTQHLPADGSVKLTEMSQSASSLVLAGPRSRDLLKKITDADLSNNAFPWPSSQVIEVAGRKVTALRVNYVGELGWELHVPMADLVHVYDAIWQAGQEFGLADFGMYAMDCLRLEKGYRSWKQDITHEYTPFDAGLERFVKLNKGDFIGRDALVKRHAAGEKERFVPLIVEGNTADAPTCSIVFKDNEKVGIVGSGGWGFRIGKSIALSYVRLDLAAVGTKLEVEILGKRFPAVVAEEPIFDPKNERLKA